MVEIQLDEGSAPIRLLKERHYYEKTYYPGLLVNHGRHFPYILHDSGGEAGADYNDHNDAGNSETELGAGNDD